MFSELRLCMRDDDANDAKAAKAVNDDAAALRATTSTDARKAALGCGRSSTWNIHRYPLGCYERFMLQ